MKERKLNAPPESRGGMDPGVEKVDGPMSQGEEASAGNRKGQDALARTNSGAEEEKKERGVLWHQAAKAVLKLALLENVAADEGTDLRDLVVECERELPAAPGEDPLRADVVVEKPAGIHVAGVIGGLLGACSSIEFLSPGTSCTYDKLLRSLEYTLKTARSYCKRTGAVLNLESGLSTIILCSHRPEKLMEELEPVGMALKESGEIPGVRTLAGTGPLPVHFVLLREIDCAAARLEWFQWLRTGLTVEEGRALLERVKNARAEEREVATSVAYVAMQANPEVISSLWKEKEVSEELKKVLAPLVREEYAEQFDELEGEVSELKGENSELKGENSELKGENSELRQVISRMLSGTQNGGIDSETLARARQLMGAVAES